MLITSPTTRQDVVIEAIEFALNGSEAEYYCQTVDGYCSNEPMKCAGVADTAAGF